MKTISPRQLNDLIQKGDKSPLLDVRTPAEHAEMHVPGVTLVPLDQLNAASLCADGGMDKAKPVYFLCRSGGRATQAAQKLEKYGFANCVVVEGGTQAWADAGLPLNRGAAMMSLERQVRLCIGIVVLVSALLAMYVNGSFVWLCAFMGCALIITALADWCGMALLLARMPWNQRGADAGKKTCCS